MTKLDIIYCRVSTDEQAGESKTSIPEQESKCRDYLNRIGYSNIKVFQEDYSGFEFERPELDKIRQLIKEGKVRSLTFLRVDRLSRQSGHLDQLREGYFRPYNIEIHSPGDLNQWGWSPSDIFMQNSLVNFSQMWGGILTQILRDGKIGMVKKNNTLACGQAPFGYKEIKTADKAYFVIDELEASTIRLIFKLYVDNGLSLGAIAKKLNQDKIETFSIARGFTTFRSTINSRWYSSTVRHILRNPVYKGEWNFGKTKTVKTYDKSGKATKKRIASDNTIVVKVEPIIESETWQRAQERLDYNRQEMGRKTVYEYLLSKRIKCYCGYAMAASTKNKGTYLYYLCPGAAGFLHNSHSSDRLNYNARYIDQKAFEWLVTIAFNPAELKRRIENNREEKRKVVEPLEERFKILDMLVSKNKAKYDKLIDLYLESSDMTKDALEQKKHELEETISQHTQEREEILYRIAQLAADFGYEMLYWPPEVHASEDMAKELEELRADFDKRRKFIEKWDLRAALIVEDGKTYLHVTCKLDSALLELYTPQLATVQKRQEVYLSFADKLLLDFTELSRIRQGVRM